MEDRWQKSRALLQRAQTSLAGGVSSPFRAKFPIPLYFSDGCGCRLRDVDGNEYIDYRLGYGPAILGHCHDEVDQAARDAQSVGTVFALGTEKEVSVAKLIKEMMPVADLVRFSNSDTEAVMAALRLARGYTGKDNYVTFEGSYHGLFDAVMWQADVEGLSDPSLEPELLAFGKGVPDLVRQLLWHLPYNDAGPLEDVLKRHADRIAAVLIEPILGSCCGIPASPEFFRAVRELCTRHGVLMLVDEVKTGFRVARGGAQELHGVTADLCTMAKAMANVSKSMGKGVASNLPASMGGRVGGTARAQAMQMNGGKKESEEAVMRGLRWLVAHFEQAHGIAERNHPLVGIVGNDFEPRNRPAP